MTFTTADNSPRGRFIAGWPDNHGFGTPKYPYGYWNLAKQQWWNYPPGSTHLDDPQLPIVDIGFVIDAGDLYDKVQARWEQLRAKHPGLIWNPREGDWREISTAPEKDQQLRAALAECDRKRDAGLFHPGEYQRCRDQAFSEFG